MTTSRTESHPPSIVHAGLDEAGSLSAATPLFTMAVVITPRPHTVANLIGRTVLRSGKRLKRRRKLASELKWRNASQRIRTGVLTRLAQADVEVFTLTIKPDGYARTNKKRAVRGFVGQTVE